MKTQPDMSQETLAFWRQQLDGAMPWLSLPKDRKVMEDGQPVVERWDEQIEKELVRRLAGLAGELGVALPIVLLTAFQVLLFRYTGWRDLVVACFDKVCGIEALPVRTVLGEDKSFLDLVKQVNTTLRQVNQYRDLPPSLWLELLPSIGSGRHSLPSPVTFAETMAGDDAADTAKTEPGIEKTGTQGDLGLAISIGESGLSTRFVYNSSVFQAGTIQWMSRHYHQLLQHAVRSPETRPDDLWLATPEELALVQQWGHGEPGPLHDQLYHERFQAQAEQRPEAAAVVYEGSQLTYREVDHRANQLAHHLQALGVGPDVVVGLLMECSPELVVATLAVFKAGGAVFLLPPASPPARLSVLVNLAAPAVVVTKKRFGELLCDACPHVVYLDDSDPCLAQRPHTAPANRVNGQNLAFLFLTSGSTGQPKIVMEPYGRLRKQYLAESWERYVLKSNTGTTFTASEIMAVTRGGTLFIAPDGIESDIRSLASFISDHGITYLILVPSALGALLSLDDLASCSSLRTVHCIGEMIPPTLKRRFFERLQTRLLVGYGCTEARGATSRWLTPDDDPALVDVGRPNATMEVFVLDAKRRPTPIGVPGEVYLGGQIADGYLNSPAATAERFIPHPFSHTPGARLFRTGDMARWLPTGNLEILGRIDDQVKIRGFRIELGEIEALLAQHPGLRQNVVVAREEVPGEKRLVAYLVPQNMPAPSPSELRRYLREKLPEYMVPSAFVMLDKLPLLPSGKVDRQALPAPGGERPQLEHAYVAPREAVEERLVAIWTELLGLEQVGIHDNFFDLGGHSLLGTRMLSRILAAFHIHVPLRSLYESPTVAAIAEIISRQQRDQEGIEKMELLREIEQMTEDEVETELRKGEKPASEVEPE